MKEALKALLERMETDLITLSEILENADINVAKIEMHLGRKYTPTNKALLLIWDDRSWIDFENSLRIPTNDVPRMLKEREILYRKFEGGFI